MVGFIDDRAWSFPSLQPKFRVETGICRLIGVDHSTCMVSAFLIGRQEMHKWEHTINMYGFVTLHNDTPYFVAVKSMV